MPQFTYKALQRDGVVAEGQVDASNRQEAMRLVEGFGKPIKLAELGGAAGAPGANGTAKPEDQTFLGLSLSGKGKITPRILENFTRLLASLLAAGVPFSRALQILQKEATVPAAKAKWKEIYDLVIDGMPMSQAMARSPETFPKVYVAMVEAGEMGGFLDVVLGQIADFQAREKENKAKAVAALTYPAILLVLAIGVIIFLMVFFIPRFQLVFKSFNATLPLLTQMIIASSQAVRDYGLYIAVVVVVAVVSLRNWFTSEKGRRAWEGFILKLPIIGPLTAQFAMARFTRMLGTLLGAGVPLINALNVARRSLGNQILVDAVSESIDRVKEGGPLGASLGRNKELFPGTIIEMITVAEESGRIDQELMRIAVTTEADVDRGLKTAVSLAEPIMLFFIAAFIGTIFIGMVYPIFSVTDNIK